jgi:2,3-bisphosphoglycerate-dependent phosphoglycerate mutase
MRKLVLIRHGQSAYNRDKIFCGWIDADLTPQGIEESRRAGQVLKKGGYVFDMAFTSVLKRAVETLNIILEEMNEKNIPVKYSWRLNERHYGALQGLKHEDMAKKYGAEQVKLWRRSYKVKPPLLELNDPLYPGNDPKYKNLDRNDIPRGESLEDTVKRVLPYWEEEIVPKINEGKRIIISASGNSLRALIKYLDGMNDEEIVGLEILTGVPLIYKLEDESLKPIRHYYLQ